MAQERRRPNILVLLVDEQRYPPCYETEALRQFRATQLPAQERLRAKGVEWHRHYVMSTACAPSRASLWTGQYPSFHGVRQTDGAAKAADEPSMVWLDPNGVPTLGDWFRALGYTTLYHGKWHVSHADLFEPGSEEPLASSDTKGKPIPAAVAAYERASCLESFGFTGWVGPEPHGAAPGNSGLRRDPFYTAQTLASFDRLEAAHRASAGPTAPWLMVSSLVNPHDIVLFGLAWLRVGGRFNDATVPQVEEPPSRREDLRTKPRCHASYVKTYGRLFAPQPTVGLYRRFYHYLHKVVDAHLTKILDRLAASPFHDDTIVVFTSDHGDLLGAHGGMHQKWHNAYEEAIHVPLIFSGPPVARAARSVNRLSCHADLLPTLLGLARADVAALRRKVGREHALAAPFPGRDLSALVRGEAGALPDEAVYFMTEDAVSEGTRTRGAMGWQFKPIEKPNDVEAVIARVDGRLWKYARYSDDGAHQVSDEHELYDLEADPMEIRNLAGAGKAAGAPGGVRRRMEELLVAERRAKRLAPDA